MIAPFGDRAAVEFADAIGVGAAALTLVAADWRLNASTDIGRLCEFAVEIEADSRLTVAAGV